MRATRAVGAVLSAFVTTPSYHRYLHPGVSSKIRISGNVRYRCNHSQLLDVGIPANVFRFGSRRFSTSQSTEDPSPSQSFARGTKLYVANVSYDTTLSSLEQYFAQYGGVLDVTLPIDRNDRSKHRGFAFVTLEDKDVASAIVSSSDSEREVHILDGKELLISMDFPRGQRVQKRFDDIASHTREKEKKKRTLFTIDDSVCPPTDEEILGHIVTKHCSTLDTYLKRSPFAAHTRVAFAEVETYAKKFFSRSGIPSQEVLSSEPGLILDSGCGTGRSTRMLGERYPNDLVIGVDRSLTRLSKNMGRSPTGNEENDSFVRTLDGQPNVLLVRAELSSFWRLIVDAGWTFRRHFLLYPNPYPKPRRLKSRFYAHPVFPTLLSIGDEIIVRSNWLGYLDEFTKSAGYVSNYYSDACLYNFESIGPAPILIKDEGSALTNFERKYYECGESVYELRLIRTSR